MSTKLALRITIIFIMILISVGVVWLVKNSSFTKNSLPFTPSQSSFELELVKEDLQTYGTFSTRVQNIILSEIDSCSAKYRIPIGLLHAIFRVESEYRFNIDHPKVTITIKGKLITTHAIGIGGVMWAIWKDSLRYHNIASKESDLYLPDVNIQASAYILSDAIKQALRDKKSPKYNLLNRVVRSYYGAYSAIYMAKMERVTSDLWMKRITKTLLNEYKSHNPVYDSNKEK